MNNDIMDLDEDGVENTSTVVRVGVEGEAVTFRFDVMDMDECVTQTLLLPPDEARYYASELVRAAEFVESHKSRS